MRRIVTGMVLLLALASLAGAQENLVTNGGFEQIKQADFLGGLPPKVREYYGGTEDSPFENWAFGGHYDKGQYTCHVSDEAHSGKHSVEIRCEKQGRGGIASAPFKLMPGAIMKVSLWVKARDAEGGRILINYEGSAGDGWNRVDLPEGTYDWQQVTQRCVVPVRNCQADGQTIVIFIYSKATGSIWIDDISVEKVDVDKMAESPSAPATTAPKPKAIVMPAGSPGYRVYAASALEKVLPDTDFLPAADLQSTLSVSLARNESEDVQAVIEAPWRDVTVSEVRFSDLAGPGGATLPAGALSWRRVDYIETTMQPMYQVPRVGLYPDPLMPAGEFVVDKLSRKPVWISLKTPADAAPGVYRGTVTLAFKGMPDATLPLTATVYDFALPQPTERHLRTMAWMGTGVIRAFYAYGWAGDANQKQSDTVKRYWDIMLEHHLGPGGEVAANVGTQKDGTYNFDGADRTLDYLISRGMNAFLMGTAPNLRRAKKEEYTPEFIDDFSKRVKAYGDHLREKGWIDKAYVYTYDEAPKKHWGEVKKIAAAIHKEAPGLRILQCLNEPEGVKELAGAVDVFDVYVAQYHKTGVAEMQKKNGTEVWLAVCCYPMDHPNLFIEYPLIDARIIPMFCWKYNAQGFEYWSVNSWGTNWRQKAPNQWPNHEWNPNTFGRYNGDGYLLYPGPDGVPYPSVRLKALRDGFEDYEYMWLLSDLVKKAEAAKITVGAVAAGKSLLNMDPIIKDSGALNSDIDNYYRFRGRVADAIVSLNKLVGKN